MFDEHDIQEGETVTVDVEVIKQTEEAWLLWNGDEDYQGEPIHVWVPKSVAEDNGDGTFEIDERVAFDKGLI